MKFFNCHHTTVAILGDTGISKKIHKGLDDSKLQKLACHSQTIHTYLEGLIRKYKGVNKLKQD